MSDEDPYQQLLVLVGKAAKLHDQLRATEGSEGPSEPAYSLLGPGVSLTNPDALQDELDRLSRWVERRHAPNDEDTPC